MAEEQKQDTTNNPEDTVIPPAATTEYIDETATDIPEPISPKTEIEQVNKEPIQVIVNIPKEENKTAITANRIAIFGTIINLALAGLTYMLFQKTAEANKTSQASLAETQKAVDQAKRANDIAEANFKFSKEMSINNDSISAVSLSLTKKSVETQFYDINQKRKEFEIENRPFIQIVDIKIDSIGTDKITTVSFNVVNMGKFPGTVTNMKTNLSFGANNIIVPNLEKKLLSAKDESLNLSVSTGYQINRIIKGRTLTEVEFSDFEKRESYIYLIVEIQYSNVGNGKKYKNIIIHRLNLIDKKMNVVSVKNESIFLN